MEAQHPTSWATDERDVRVIIGEHDLMMLYRDGAVARLRALGTKLSSLSCEVPRAVWEARTYGDLSWRQIADTLCVTKRDAKDAYAKWNLAGEPASGRAAGKHQCGRSVGGR
jgi:hypothetical protein